MKIEIEGSWCAVVFCSVLFGAWQGSFWAAALLCALLMLLMGGDVEAETKKPSKAVKRKGRK